MCCEPPGLSVPSWHTANFTGHRLLEQPAEGQGNLRIVAALVNSLQDDVGRESVTLLNATPEPIDLSCDGAGDFLPCQALSCLTKCEMLGSMYTF